jgi:membrane-bound serine protease (ClpP class)
VLIRVDGPILSPLQEFLERKLIEAERRGADLLILEIDSPGGAVDITLELVDRLQQLSWARTVAYVPREALSGAAFLALACDEIVMTPRARMGDAGPVIFGDDALFRHAPEKVRSDLALIIRDLAKDKGRPPALAEAMIDMNLAVYRCVHVESGEVAYLSDPELEAMDQKTRGLWDKGPLVLESKPGSFLEVNGQRAVELKLAVATVSDQAELEQRYPTAQPLVVLQRNAVDTTVELLNSPWITAVLFIVGATALYIEFSAPGIGLGGLVAGLCVTLFFWSRFLGGTAGWLEVILVVAGAIFLAVEIFVIPGFGVTGIIGLLLMGTGIVLASQNHALPQSTRGLHEMVVSLGVLAGSGLVSLVLAAFLTRHYGSLPVFNRLVLRAPSAADALASTAAGKPLPPVRRFQAQVGDQGVAESPLRPAGKARFGDEYLDVVTDGSYVERGHTVRIIEISGNRVMVRELEPSTQDLA